MTIDRSGAAHCLDRPIAYLEAAKDTHAVIGLAPGGLRIRALPESACRVIVEVLGDGFKAMPRGELVQLLKKVREEETTEVRSEQEKA